MSEDWCMKWLDCIQVAIGHGLPDHYLIFLTNDKENWDPIPLCMLKCWPNFPGYKQFVIDQWCCFDVVRLSSYALKVKFKLDEESYRPYFIFLYQRGGRRVRGRGGTLSFINFSLSVKDPQ